MQRKYGRIILSLVIAVFLIAILAACNQPQEEQTGNPVKRVMLNITEYSFTSPDESIRLSAVVLPEDADDKTLTWTNSDPNVANLNSEYTVVPLINGETVITVTSVSSGLTAECKITVNLPEVEPPVLTTPVTGVIISPDVLELTEIGASSQIIADVTPFSATNQNVVWSSSDPSVATVDGNGVVTAVKEGTSVVTVTTEEGGFNASCSVTVKLPKQETPSENTTEKPNNSGSSDNSGNSGSSGNSSSSGNSGSSSSGNSGSSSSGNSGSSSTSVKLPSIPAARTDADHFLISDNLLDFNKVNSDVKAWLYVPGTNMNFPVAQTEDNDFYLTRGLDKKSKYTGSCYIDFRNELLIDSNTILYGHAKGTDIFDQLENVTQTKDWFSNKDNMYVCLNTLDELTVWQVFACYYTDADADYYLYTNFFLDEQSVLKKYNELAATDPQKAVFGLLDPKEMHDFMTDDDAFVEFMTGWRTRAVKDRYGDVNNYLKSRDYGVKIEAGDRVITLSTCADSSGPIRYVLLAKLIASKPRP
jgi:SrtB family sortase